MIGWGPSVPTVISLFEAQNQKMTWNKVVRQVGLEPRVQRAYGAKRYNKHEIIYALAAAVIFYKLDDPFRLTYTLYRDWHKKIPGHPSPRSVMRQYKHRGGWQAALQELAKIDPADLVREALAVNSPESTVQLDRTAAIPQSGRYPRTTRR